MKAQAQSVLRRLICQEAQMAQDLSFLLWYCQQYVEMLPGNDTDGIPFPPPGRDLIGPIHKHNTRVRIFRNGEKIDRSHRPRDETLVPEEIRTLMYKLDFDTTIPAEDPSIMAAWDKIRPEEIELSASEICGSLDLQDKKSFRILVGYCVSLESLFDLVRRIEFDSLSAKRSNIGSELVSALLEASRILQSSAYQLIGIWRVKVERSHNQSRKIRKTNTIKKAVNTAIVRLYLEEKNCSTEAEALKNKFWIPDFMKLFKCGEKAIVGYVKEIFQHKGFVERARRERRNEYRASIKAAKAEFKTRRSKIKDEELPSLVKFYAAKVRVIKSMQGIKDVDPGQDFAANINAKHPDLLKAVLSGDQTKANQVRREILARLRDWTPKVAPNSSNHLMREPFRDLHCPRYGACLEKAAHEKSPLNCLTCPERPVRGSLSSTD